MKREFWEKLSWFFGIGSFLLIFIGLCLSLGLLKDILVNAGFDSSIGGILINAGVGFATASMMVYVALQVREIRKDRDLSLRKEHTEELRKKVVMPWIEELMTINDAKKDYSPYPKKYYPPYPKVKIGVPYKGEPFEVERIEPILFEDFLKNHATEELKNAHKKFKESSKKLYESTEKLKNNIEKFLKENRIEILESKEIYNIIKSNKINDKSRGIYFKYETLGFFLDNLLKETNEKIELSKSYRNNYPTLKFYYKDNKGNSTVYGECLCMEITEEKMRYIKNTIGNLLKEAKEKFKNDIKEIHNLIDDINNNKKIMYEELKKFEHKRIYDGNCEYIKYP
ncbi:hypothetical protein [Methanotorris igneus]|nr:hypothetical protein [Methanotorris igneus]